ncbi:WPP domain-interacting protein 2-like [Hibiscus syriacus]|uniref:WPP domain-interacting protein 2-like n=1 Tax=Hibiscus syriacus TaxID=106335 RepID=UPI0019207635|nr:WPP domain-interacting protein 2-like [Hibiscus syriacus]
MDLESECPVVEFSEGNESPQHTIPHADANKIKNNQVDACKIKDSGLCANDDFTADVHVNGPAGIALPMHSSPPAKSTPKGYGLKKWRRIKRGFVKEPSPVMDSPKTLKRSSSGSKNPTPQHMVSTEIKQNSEPRIRPVAVSTKKNTNFASGFMMHSPRSESTENTPRGSKSATAASMPQVLPTVLGYVHRRNHMKNFSEKNVGNLSPRVQQVKGSVESSNKKRGERVKIEKENSQSSIGSDSRSSNFGFMSSPLSVASKGKQSGNSLNFDGKNHDEAHEGEDQIYEEVQTAHRKENSGEIEELSLDNLAADLSREAKEEKSESHWVSPNQDLLTNSILSLQSVQEALEREIHKFEEIGKEPTSLDDGFVNMESIHADSTFADQETSSSDRLDSEKISCTSDSLEPQLYTLKHKVNYLESKLEEARAVLRARELKISELETSVNGSWSRKEEPGGIAELQQSKYRETEFDLKGLFQQRMEAETELLALRRTVQKLRDFLRKRQTTVFKEQTSAGVQARKLNNSQTGEVSKMQMRVYKATLCFLTQLVLLVLVFLFVILQLTPFTGIDVPT